MSGALQSLAQLTSSQIVNCFALGTAIAAVAGSASALAGRRSSGIRFAIWFAALVAIASLFVLPHSIVPSPTTVHVTAPEISLRPQWAVYIFAVWALIAFVGLGRVVRGLWRVRDLKQSCVPLEASLANSLQPALTQATRQFALCTSDRLRVPAALGFLRPIVVLPTWSVRELSHEELHTVVLHEAAHLQRWDDWTNLLQKIIRALLFFHPAVWWIDSRLSLEREMSCDDIVLARSRSARQYAACLVSLAEKTRAHRSLALVQAAVSQLRHTAVRLSRILDGRERTSTPLLRPALATAVTFGAVTFVAVQHTPQLVSFRNSTTSVQTASANKFDYVSNADALTATAVPASLHRTLPVPARGGAKSQPRKSARPQAQPSVPREIPPVEQAREQLPQRNPAVVNAAMSDATAPKFVYLVTQTEQYDDFGNVVVTTSVWRIRVVKPVPEQAQRTVAPHQT